MSKSRSTWGGKVCTVLDQVVASEELDRKRTDGLMSEQDIALAKKDHPVEFVKPLFGADDDRS